MSQVIDAIERCFAAPLIATPLPELLRRAVKVPAEYDLITESAARCRSLGAAADPDPQPVAPLAMIYVDPYQVRQIEQAITLDLGVLARLRLSSTSLQELRQGRPWRSGHGVPLQRTALLDCWLVGFNSVGPVAWIHGRRQKMSWGFLCNCADTAYVPIPDFDSHLIQRTFDVGKLKSLLPRDNSDD